MKKLIKRAELASEDIDAVTEAAKRNDESVEHQREYTCWTGSVLVSV